MIEGISAIGSASASVRAPQSAAAPTEGPSFDQALTQAIGAAIDTCKPAKRSPSRASKLRRRR